MWSFSIGTWIAATGWYLFTGEVDLGMAYGCTVMTFCYKQGWIGG